ncbi:unnamed protein product [Durusdinium trenchii]|uniref:Uncharacterized protein n=1 Tax=Durusdinium trenchii TaxID=1381693 RepID=A0ABP0I383_9DINO
MLPSRLSFLVSAQKAKPEVQIEERKEQETSQDVSSACDRTSTIYLSISAKVVGGEAWKTCSDLLPTSAAVTKNKEDLFSREQICASTGCSKVVLHNGSDHNFQQPALSASRSCQIKSSCVPHQGCNPYLPSIPIHIFRIHDLMSNPTRNMIANERSECGQIVMVPVKVVVTIEEVIVFMVNKLLHSNSFFT